MVGKPKKNFPLFWCCCLIRDSGSGMDKNQDPDKHPGSAALIAVKTLLSF
jgi:hypothetical protein